MLFLAKSQPVELTRTVGEKRCLGASSGPARSGNRARRRAGGGASGAAGKLWGALCESREAVTCSVLLSTGERGKGEHWFREQKMLSLCHLED